MAPRRTRSRTSLASLAIASLAVVAACTSPDADQDPDGEEIPAEEVAAEAFAAALSSGDLAEAPLTDDIREQAQADADTALEAMTDIPREVSVSWVSSPQADGDGEAADAAMRWSWQVPGAPTDFSYPITVRLSHDSDEVWQVEWSRDLLGRDLGEQGVYEVSHSDSERGDILGADGQVLVTARDVFRIGIDKTFIDSDQWEEDALALAEELDLPDPQAYADRVLSAGERAFLDVLVVPQEEPDDMDFAALREIEGVHFVADHRYLGPTDTFARPILGRVGEATAEMIEESDGELVAGDVLGLSGLNRTYDSILAGIDGTTIEVVDGEERTEVFAADPVPGTALELTLDADIQVAAENTLASVEPASAIVAIQPSTGNVLAAASGPGSEGWSTATLGQYAPGSTFKMVTALALLRAGVDPEDTLDCTEQITVDGRAFSNYPDYPDSALGEITLTEVIAHSCNTALIGQHDEISAGDIADAAASLGFGPGGPDDPPDGFERYLGQVPADATGTTHAAGLIGQGEVLAAPLTMATVAASVVAGHTVFPQLVLNPVDGDDDGATEDGDDGSDSDGADEGGAGSGNDNANDNDADGDGADGDGDVDGGDAEGDDDASTDPDDSDAAAQEATPLTNTEAAMLRQMMRRAVTDGTAEVLAEVSGEPVGAKTGTAEHGTDGLNRAWMIAYQDDLAVAVFVEEGEHGAGTAGPLMRSFLDDLN